MEGQGATNRELLEQFGLMAEEDLATLMGSGVKSLQHRARSELPPFVKAGRRRLYPEASVREWLGLPAKPVAPTVSKTVPIDRRRAIDRAASDLRRV
jgi:hypothetical protein